MLPSPEDLPLIDPEEQAREDWELDSRSERVKRLAENDRTTSIGGDDPMVWERFGEFVHVLEHTRDRLEEEAKAHFGGTFPDYMRCARELADVLAALRCVDGYLWDTAVDFGEVSWEADR